VIATKARPIDLELFRGIASCPECGSVVWAYDYGASSGVEIRDLGPIYRERIEELLGAGWSLRQGYWSGGGRDHSLGCPPAHDRVEVLDRPKRRRPTAAVSKPRMERIPPCQPTNIP
jgi:hypothetical protein